MELTLQPGITLGGLVELRTKRVLPDAHLRKLHSKLRIRLRLERAGRV